MVSNLIAPRYCIIESEIIFSFMPLNADIIKIVSNKRM
jgi:hypothetical protein